MNRYCKTLAAASALALFSAFAARAELPDPTTFGVAMEVGDTAKARAWLDEGLAPDFIADRIGSGLMIGAWEGNIALMELFLQRGADINLINANGEQALQLAAWQGHTKALQWLLDHGARINRGGREWSALHYAVFAGHGDLAKTLFARGANVNAQSPNGSSVLMMAAREGHEDLAKALLDAGADPTLKNESGDNALIWAMRHGNLRIARMVASADQFAAAARMPAQSFGAAIRSVPPPGRIADLLRQIRIAEGQGKPTAELRKLFFAAVNEFKRDASAKPTSRSAKPKAAKAPAGLVITAERRNPGGERAEVVYAAPATTVNANDPAELLRRIGEAEARGKPTAELRRAFLDAVRRYKGDHGGVP
ncbi:MAG: ankyrin repeat domain-containing protein [Rhodocyclaceae bacterium]|nr:ankyrin repeat domain-containing protein [Rhodocyclaceae bacterium]